MAKRRRDTTQLSSSDRQFNPLRMIYLVLRASPVGWVFLGVLVPLIALFLVTIMYRAAGGIGIVEETTSTTVSGSAEAQRNAPATTPATMPPDDTILKSLLSPPQQTYHIFQVARPHTGSAILNNILLGLFENGVDQNQAFMHAYDYIEYVPPPLSNEEDPTFEQIIDPRQYKEGERHHESSIYSTVVTKTHLVRIDVQIEKFEGQFDHIFFLVAQRGNNTVASRYCSDDKGSKYRGMVLCLDYDDFHCQTREEMVKSVATVRRRIQQVLPYFSRIQFDEAAAVERLVAMSETTERLKNEPLEVYDTKFGIYGGRTASTSQ
mmetsp:Transcript_2470/g.5684  ORF Transcript_2470/g.5684 Transcript_2470/m.5684 type:complete len:321 (+) Transcript_2470:109-1071(+)